MRNLLFIFILFLLFSCSKDFDDLKEISSGLEWTRNLYTEEGYNLTPQGMTLAVDSGFFLIENGTLEKRNLLGEFEFRTTATAQKIIKTDNGFLTSQQAPSKVIALNNDLSFDWEFPLNDDVDYLFAANDGYLLTHSSSKVGITKLSFTGEVIWQQIIDESNSHLNAIQKTTNGFIAIGQQPSTDIGTDTWIVRLDDSGAIIWEKTYENSKTLNSKGINIFELDNGNFLALSSATNLDYDATSIMILDGNGEVINENQPNDTYYKSMIQTSDGDFIAIGSGYFPTRRIPFPAPYTSSFYHSAIVTKINQEGKRLWQIEKFVSDYENIAHSVIETKDNDIIVIADGSDYYSENVLQLFKINSEN